MKKTSFYSALCGTCIALVALAPLSLIFRPGSSIFEPPLTEDGYYLLSVSRNIALGNGLTIDGHHWTNGFHPLFAFLVAPVYAIFHGDRYASLRGVLFLHWIMHIATALLLGSIVKTGLRSRGSEQSAIAYWLTVFLWLASRYVILNSYNGLETGCTLLLYAIAWRLYQCNRLDGRRLAGFGAVLGMLVLARIDAAIFVVTLAATELFRRTMIVHARVLRAAVIAFIPFVISSPWWLYNLLFFGSLMPSSGSAQAAPFSPSRIEPMVRSVLQVGVPYLQIRWIGGVPQMLTQAAVLLVIAITLAKSSFSGMKDGGGFRMGAVLLLSSLFLGLYYLFFSGSSHFYGRYMSPLMLISIPLAGVALTEASRFHPFMRMAILAPIGLIAVMSILGWDARKRVSGNPFYDDQLQLIEACVPPLDTVGSGQTGTIGYFRDHVVNLDGKVNGEAVAYRNRIGKYLDLHHIVWYCDWESGDLGSDPEANGWMRVSERGRFLLYHHVERR